MERQPEVDVSIGTLSSEDRDAALEVINAAARWYGEFLPPDEVPDPEMTAEGWDTEARRMTWYGAYADGRLVGVIGLEYVSGAALLRHWYVHPDVQRRGIGSRLRAHLEQQAEDVERIIAGTYADNHKARAALQQAGYRLSDDPRAVLDVYYDVPDDRQASSVTYERTV